MPNYSAQFDRVINATQIFLSDLKPSEWYEQNMVMSSASAIPGPFTFDHTPYWREPLDCAAKDHPAKEVSIMKGNQLGGTAAVLNALVGYTIAQNPGPLMFLTGHSDLTKSGILKIDGMIDACGIRNLIKPTIQRAKKTRSGDTDIRKEFRGGHLIGGSVTNHNMLRQEDIMIMIVDDFDAAPYSSKKAGSTRELVVGRTKAFAHKRKIYYVSSPQLKGQSNIEEVFLLGDQRYYYVPCPQCGVAIALKWHIPIEGKDHAGIYWQTDNAGKLIPQSIGYICQDCGNLFTERHKYEMNLAGRWKPTVEAAEPYHYSYQMNSLYAPAFMENWEFYVRNWMTANPEGEERNEKKMQTFTNLALGETYQMAAEAPKANQLQKNIRPYYIGTIPEKLSLAEGNGKIVLLTMAVDLNGVVEDARIDYEVVATAENGVTYSVTHGSVGTFIPREGAKKNKEDRLKWTYEHYRQNSVWPRLREVMEQRFPIDGGERTRGIVIAGIDIGHYDNFAWTFIDSMQNHDWITVVGVKGDEEKYVRHSIDASNIKLGKSRPNMFIILVGQVKDELAKLMKLKHDPGNDDKQPPGFMNFPSPADGKYGYENFFEHYESEHSVPIETARGQLSWRWEKVGTTKQNHLWDVRVYNMALREIQLYLYFKQYNYKNYTWKDYVDLTLGRI